MHSTGVQEDGAGAVGNYLFAGVTNQKDAGAVLLELAQALKAFDLEACITDGQGLVDDQDIRIDLGLNGKGQAYHHAAGVGLYRLVDKVTYIGKGDDAVEAVINFFPAESEHRRVQIYVFSTAEFRIKTRAQFQ
ncbi:hypothetical protein D3C81_1824430 [compost metagenome]